MLSLQTRLWLRMHSLIFWIYLQPPPRADSSGPATCHNARQLHLLWPVLATFCLRIEVLGACHRGWAWPTMPAESKDHQGRTSNNEGQKLTNAEMSLEQPYGHQQWAQTAIISRAETARDRDVVF
jgi:hypothetical protein